MEFTKEQKLYQQVVQKAWEDTVFKDELIANPVSAIEKLIGEKLNISEGKTLVVRDQTNEGTVYINIPAMPEVDVELNEEELEKVAGGCQHGDSGTFTVITFPQFPQ
ncbi:MAG: hypothetical protein JKY02_05810, partial [Flavobacteriaceae bacterium]|nr:hypothetical protein [Flavobacteriaceae bacterium]